MRWMHYMGRVELVTGEVELECSSRRAEFESIVAD